MLRISLTVLYKNFSPVSSQEMTLAVHVGNNEYSSGVYRTVDCAEAGLYLLQKLISYVAGTSRLSLQYVLYLSTYYCCPS